VTLRVAIAGCGMIAGTPLRDGRPIATTHAAAAREAAGVELVAACDPDADRARAFAQHWGVPTQFAGVESMCRESKADILVVAVPPHEHERVSLEGLRAGVRGLLVEKPFTGTREGAARILAAARERRVPVVVNFMRRWDASHRALAERIRRGELGAIRAVHGVYTGTIRGNGSHMVDTLRMMLGAAELRIARRTPIAGGQTDGPVSFTLEGSGVDVAVTVIEDAEYFVFELVLVGTRGRARLLRSGNDIRIDLPAPSPENPGYRYLLTEEKLPNDTLPGAFVQALVGLRDAVLAGDPSSPAAVDTLESLAMVDRLAQPLEAHR
jgi:predicted dehydrogenase